LVLTVWKWLRFYTCDETWNQEDEISLLTGDVVGAKNNEFLPVNLLDAENTKIIYVYD
jgi:hypothetical protein